MASKFWQKQRGEFSSFWSQEVAGPVKETYLKLLAWRNQAIGYLGLRRESMALRQGVEPSPTVLNPAGIQGTPEYGALRRAMVLGGGAVSFLGLCDYLFNYLPYVAEHGTSEGFSVVPGFNNPPEASVGGASFSSGFGDVPSETPGATPSQTATVTETATQTSTETVTEAATKTPEPTAEATKTEIPAAGKLMEDIRCIDASDCANQTTERLSVLIPENNRPISNGWSYKTKEALSVDGTNWEYPILWVEKATYLGYFVVNGLKEIPDGIIVLVFGQIDNGATKIIPAIPVGAYTGEIGIVQTHFVDWGTPSPGGTQGIGVKEIISDQLLPGNDVPRLTLALSYPRNPGLDNLLTSQRILNPNDRVWNIMPLTSLEIVNPGQAD